jgi:hypothetical protein
VLGEPALLVGQQVLQQPEALLVLGEPALLVGQQVLLRLVPLNPNPNR